jgi:hypothetical protein
MNGSKEIAEKLEGKIIEFVSQEDISNPLSHLIALFPPQAFLLIIGGALRNFIIKYFYEDAPPTIDIDIIIGGLGANFPMGKTLRSEKFKNTDFGGVRWYPKKSSFSFDLSLLDNFLPIRKFHLEPDRTQLLATIDFDVNALMLDVKQHRFHEKGAITAIRKKTIGFNSDKIYDKGFLAYRLLLIRHKIGFYPSRDAFKFLRFAVDLDMLISIKKTLESRFGKHFSKIVLAEYDRICRYKNYEDYKRHERPSEYLLHSDIDANP